MDCCSHEGPAKGDAKFDFKRIADGVHVAVAAPAYKVNCNTAIIESDDGVIIVDTHSKPSAARVSTYGDYRPWRAGLLRNIERTYAMVS